MKSPCPDCPFRKQNGINCLGKKRAEEITQQIPEYGFVCHKTVDYSKEDGEEDRNRKQCAVSMILSIKTNTPNPFIQLHERLIGVKPELLNQDLIVDSFDEFIKLQTNGY